MQITPLFAALLALMFIALSFRIVSLRRRLKVSLGDGGERELVRAIRIHGNFAEYVPLGLVMLFLVEAQATTALVVYGLGALLFFGRIAHVYGLLQEKVNFRFRVGGMVMTFSMLFISALILLGHWVTRFFA